MKKRAILIALGAAFLMACTRGAAPLQAIYLVQGQGQLDPAELAAHPEVAVVHTWADFQRLAQTKVALWIDKDAVDLVDRQWLNQAPQRSYPLVVVGYSSALYAFREALPAFGISGPYIDWSTATVGPGFSVWMLRDETGASHAADMKGYQGVPTVPAILEKTNALLEEKAHRPVSREGDALAGAAHIGSGEEVAS